MDYAFERFKFHEMIEPKQPYIDSMMYEDENLVNKAKHGNVTLKVLKKRTFKVLSKEHSQKCYHSYRKTEGLTRRRVLSTPSGLRLSKCFPKSTFKSAPCSNQRRKSQCSNCPGGFWSLVFFSKSTFKGAPQRALPKVLFKEHFQKCSSDRPLTEQHRFSCPGGFRFHFFFEGVNKSEKLRMNLSGS